MKKAFLNKIIIGAIMATTMTTLTPLGVSASTNNSKTNNRYNLALNGTWNYFDKTGDIKTGWIKDNGKWYYCDNTGAMQTGVIKVNDKTYCLNTTGAMETGKVIVNNKTYKCSSNGQVATTKIPTCDKAFDSNNSIVKNNNQNSTVTNSNNNQGTTDTGNTNTTSAGSTTNAGNTTTDNATTTESTTNVGNTTTDNATTTASTTDVGNTTTDNTTTAGSTTTTNNTSTDVTTVDVQGLPQLPKTYSINVQASAEDQILQLMNAKRVEAGLQPLTLDNTLLQVARYKSDHMIQYNYFDHTNPDGTKWTDWLQTIGYKYTTAGENIAYNTYDAVELFNQWWNSPGHRANMMNSSYTKVGIGVVQGNGEFMGTQEFSN